MNLKSNPEDQGKITNDFLKKLAKTDFKTYYSTPQLNDVLYLHYKGFSQITNLNPYTGLKVLYLQGNAFKKIQGLDNLVNLRCLYLQENMICKIQGLDNLVNLVNLNLSDNQISKIQGLSTLVKVQNVQLKRNRIGGDGIEDLKGLLECPSISALDISDNHIDNQEIVEEILIKMPQLSVAYLQNNQFSKKVAHYRKILINDKPVFEDERRFSQAWSRGGLQEERKQRDLYKKQKEQQQLKQHRDFKELMQKYKQEANKKKQQQKNSSSENQSQSKESNLESYNTPSPAESEQSRQATDQSEQSQQSSQKQESQKSKSEKGHGQGYLDQLD